MIFLWSQCHSFDFARCSFIYSASVSFFSRSALKWWRAREEVGSWVCNSATPVPRVLSFFPPSGTVGRGSDHGWWSSLLILLSGKRKRETLGASLGQWVGDVFVATISNFSRMFKPGNEFWVVTRDARALDCYVLIFLRCCVSFGLV